MKRIIVSLPINVPGDLTEQDIKEAINYIARILTNESDGLFYDKRIAKINHSISGDGFNRTNNLEVCFGEMKIDENH